MQVDDPYALPIDGTVILGGIVGSTAYGLATEDSDIDRLAVYVTPTKTVLGLDGPQVVTNDRRDEIFHYGHLAATDPEQFQQSFERHRTKLDSMGTILPDEPNRVEIERVLLTIREAFL